MAEIDTGTGNLPRLPVVLPLMTHLCGPAGPSHLTMTMTLPLIASLPGVNIGARLPGIETGVRPTGVGPSALLVVITHAPRCHIATATPLPGGAVRLTET